MKNWGHTESRTGSEDGSSDVMIQTPTVTRLKLIQAFPELLGMMLGQQQLCPTEPRVKTGVAPLRRSLR